MPETLHGTRKFSPSCGYSTTTLLTPGITGVAFDFLEDWDKCREAA